jgi:hypothetical protein
MTRRSLRALAAAAVAITLGTVLARADQVRRQGPAEVPLEVSLKVGGVAYEAKGQGSCTHAPKASIYDVAAEMWSVRQRSDARSSVALTFWKPSDGSPTMFSLSVTHTKSTSISTVKGGQVTGSGTVTLSTSGKGGTFTVAAKTSAGEAVAGTIKCEAFTPAIAEGGD